MWGNKYSDRSTIRGKVAEVSQPGPIPWRNGHGGRWKMLGILLVWKERGGTVALDSQDVIKRIEQLQRKQSRSRIKEGLKELMSEKSRILMPQWEPWE